MAQQEFHMTILGRTIEHLGTQMYKHRAPSIAELVANCWDAGAANTWIIVPEADQYDPNSSEVTIMDDGEGMDQSAIEHCYLVVGRNRRSDDGGEKHGRKIMGRKGIGKLAGFGLAEKVSVITWRKDTERAIRFSMSLQQLKGDADGKAHDIKFPWDHVEKQTNWPSSGTRIELSGLRHTTPIGLPMLEETLSRRFSRTTHNQMAIMLNDATLQKPTIETIHRYPENKEYEEEDLPGGQKILYRYQFARKPLRSKELQGFAIYANERTAQAPPFFFNVESTASSQHSTRYVTGEIVADYLDSSIDSESDLISTDRQELDWENQKLQDLREWGGALTRRILRECGEMHGERLENWILEDEGFARRLGLMDLSTKREIGRFLKVLGQRSDADDIRTRELADALIRAYEFRTFHDVIGDIERAGEDPEKLEEILGRLHDWKVLESRAILEIVRGRLDIIEKLESMIVHDAPETASKKTYDNLHDLLAEYPWIFNPEWQVFAEEKTISKQLKEFGERDCPDDMKKKRVDFLAFAKDTDALVIIEMKRPGHAVDLEELQRLEQYQVSFMRSRGNCHRVLIYGGTCNIPELKWKEMSAAEDFEALTWGEMFRRTKSFYSHYAAVLNGDIEAEGFRRKAIEVARTRQILDTGSSHRSSADRKRGVGSSDP